MDQARPAPVLLAAVIGTQLLATCIAVYGLLMTPLGLGRTGLGLRAVRVPGRGPGQARRLLVARPSPPQTGRGGPGVMSQVPGPGGWMAGVERVSRPVAQARVTYDRVAAVYDLAENPFEYRARRRLLGLLAARPGERILEIGPGTGHAMVALARGVGPTGQVIGADLSARMLARSRRRAARAGCASRIPAHPGRCPPAAAAGRSLRRRVHDCASVRSARPVTGRQAPGLRGDGPLGR